MYKLRCKCSRVKVLLFECVCERTESCHASHIYYFVRVPIYTAYVQSLVKNRVPYVEHKCIYTYTYSMHKI